MPPSRLVQILEDHLIVAWSEFRTSYQLFNPALTPKRKGIQVGKSDIPWDDVPEDPNKFYDTTTFKLPCKLKAPK